MNEGLQEEKIPSPEAEPVHVSREVEAVHASPAAEAEHPFDLVSSFPPMSGRGWLRVAYTVEFFIAILVIFTLWSEVGGQGHLDLIPWYVKLICVLGSAWCCVRFTAGMAEETTAWNRRSIGWLGGIVLFAIVMGGITYYYHLHEDQDDDSDDTTSTATVIPGRPYYYASDRTWR